MQERVGKEEVVIYQITIKNVWDKVISWIINCQEPQQLGKKSKPFGKQK